MIEQINNSANMAMQKVIDSLKQALIKLRTGRANPSLLEHLRIPQSTGDVLLNRLASITVGDARTLVITPWDKSSTQAIEKAIMTAELGLNPTTTGNIIRVPLPILTEQRRREMSKIVNQEAETARVSIRTHRRNAINSLKESLKKKEISEDADRRAQEAIQKITDKYIAEIDKIAQMKEKELMEI